MNSVILCEGFDDAYILGYYLHKTSDNPKWQPYKGGQFSSSFDLPRTEQRNRGQDVYFRDDDRLAIWCTGGKDRVAHALGQIKHLCTMHPQERFQTIVVLLDRDTADIADCVSGIAAHFCNMGWDVTLSNNTKTVLTYVVEGETYEISIVPLIIPFEQQGALETVLMASIAASGEEEKYVVEQAQDYIQQCLTSGKLLTYLQHSRLQLKAGFSAVISVTNPDRSTTLFDTLLMTFPWEQSPTIKVHFGLLEKLFNQ